MAPAVVRRTPYKDLLQPALQRRFSTAASILLAIAYVQAVLLANWSSYFWSWFPIGPAGVKTGFFFLCGLSIIILRIAQYHVGLRTTNSGFETFTKNALKLQTLEAVASYTLSSWLFSQIYLWSAPDSANLSWITFHSGDRARLNEKPLFFTTHFIVVGMFQGINHIFRDDDRLLLGQVTAKGEPKPGQTTNPFKRFGDAAPVLLISSGTQASILVAFNVFFYPLFVRHIAWRTALAVFRPFYSLPKTNMLPASLPFSIWLLVRCIAGGFMISFVWMAANTAFSIFLVREPLKNGRPLTSDSKDPNGSLLNGLKSKKLSIRCFAMWELAFIARDYDVRRKAIYEDIDRKDGPMWSQVYAICMDVLKGVEARIDNYGKAPAPPPAAVTNPDDVQVAQQRISQPPKNDPVFVSTPTKKSVRGEVEKVVGQVATSPGQTSRLSPLAKKALIDAKGKLEAFRQEATGASNPDSPLGTATRRFLNSPVGWPFRQEFRRRLTAVVLGSPYGEPSLYINATTALSLLAVHSLQEDRYGKVQLDVSTIIRTLTAVTKKLEAFKAGFPSHWTDLGGAKETPEVDALIAALREALSELVVSFGPYSRDLRLGLTDMRLAREAAGIENKDEPKQLESRPEMRQIR